ncbi:MAG: hypothetical protein IKC22_03425 [Bacilli bacterium]|nr:hypothetical protein [Bacilli bacterium]
MKFGVFSAVQTELWDTNVWAFILVVGILFGGMILAHMLKKMIPALNKMLIPASVLGGLLILVFTTLYQIITKDVFFDLKIFAVDLNNEVTGTSMLDSITYHCLGIGFVAMSLRTSDAAKKKGRMGEVIDTGVTTVSTYLIQAIIGLLITIPLAQPVVDGLIEGSGVLLALGFGQGTGQAMNFGKAFADQVTIMPDYYLKNGKDFGLAIAALGFLCASIGGVIYLNILKRQGKVKIVTQKEVEELSVENIQTKDEIGMNESIDKFSVQLAFVMIVYALSYGAMQLVKGIFGDPNTQRTIFGFNFLIGTLLAILLKNLFRLLRKAGLVKHQYLNNFMLNRISGVAFDIMIVSGIAAINLELLKGYWYVLLLMTILGAISTFIFIRFVSKKFHSEYKYEQFMGMYGMLTGTASTGIILLREIDPNFKTPASDNLVYQNLPAIILGFPMLMLIKEAVKSREHALWVLLILVGYLAFLMIILFRRQIFKSRKKKNPEVVKE